MGVNCCKNKSLQSITIEVPDKDKVYYQIHEDKAFIIQRFYKKFRAKRRERELILARTQLLDNKINEFGRYVDIKYVMSRISKKILDVEKNLPMFIGEPNEKEYFEKNKIIREPFEYKLDRSIYHGTWNPDGLRHGYGYLIRENGSKLEGLWQNGELYKGRIFDSTGNFYEGKIKNLEPISDGLYVGVNGIRYTGHWRNGMYNDYGELSFPDKTIYKGSFFNNNFNGKGIITWPSGLIYEGNFQNHNINGKGIITTKDGDCYSGDWENNIPHGNGCYEWKKHGAKYQGEYKFGRKEGFGKYDFSDGEFYEGNWHNDKPHGQGRYKTKNKEIKGSWRYGTLIESSDPSDTSRKSGFFNELWKSNSIIEQMSYYVNAPRNYKGDNTNNENKRLIHFAEIMKV